MKKLAILALASMLAACGGGGSDSASGSTQNSVQDVQTQQPPAAKQTATIVSGTNATIDSSGGDFIVRSAQSMTVTLNGSTNNVTFDTNQAAGNVTITGGMNTVVFKAGATVQTLAVTGNGNTFWIPEGSGISVTGSGAASATVKTYKP